MIQRHKQEAEIIDFLEAAEHWEEPVRLDACSEVVDVRKFCQSMKGIIKAGCSKRQYNLAISHVKKLKNQIS